MDSSLRSLSSCKWDSSRATTLLFHLLKNMFLVPPVGFKGNLLLLESPKIFPWDFSNWKELHWWT